MKLKKTILSVMACAVSLVMLFSLAACGDETKKDPQVTAIALDKTEASVNTGETVRLTVKATYDDDTSADLSSGAEGLAWKSSDESIATVTRGVVSGKAQGETTVTATYGDYTATCSVTVYSLVVEISDATASLEKGATKQLTASVKKAGTATDDKVEWSSSDPSVATVDATTGLVTAWAEGTSTVTAKRAGGNQSATCAVSVTWSNKPASYAAMDFAEQNKLEENVWGYWNGQPGWSTGEATAYEAYTEDYETGKTAAEGYEYIGLNKATFDFEVTDYLANWTYQAFFRSTNNQEGGKLEYNHDYEVTFKIKSNQAGEVTVSPYDDVRAQNAGETADEYKAYVDGLIADGTLTEHDFEIEANVETTLTVKFRHDDCGYVFADGVYDNMGSAIHLQLAGLGKDGGRVQVSVYDFQFKDLGPATYPVADDESKHAGATNDYPAHPADPEVKHVSASSVTGVTLTVEGEKAIYNLAGTVDLAQFGNDVATAKTWLTATHFDLQQCGGSWTGYAFDRVDVTVNADGTFLIKYDITYLPLDSAGTGAYTSHFTEKETSEDGYDANHYRDVKLDETAAVPGASITVGNKKYTIVNNVGGIDQASNWGCVAIKVENV